MDEFGVVVVMIVSQKQEELHSFNLDVTNYCESSLLLMSLLPRWLVLLSDPEDCIVCAPTEALESLLRWVCIESSELCGRKQLVFGDGYGKSLWSYL